MRATLDKLLRKTLYVMDYGATGVGKSTLPMTLSENRGADTAYVTAEHYGITPLLTQGYRILPSHVELLPGQGEDPFEVAIAAVKEFTAMPAIRTIVADGLTVLCGRAVDFYSQGQGEKALGWEGWGVILNGFRQLEGACDLAARAGKNIIYTASESAPEYEDTLAGKVLRKEGGLWLQGRGRDWMPLNVDIICRHTSTFRTVVVNGKAQQQFHAELQLRRRDNYLAKTRWAWLPDPCKADLKYILQLVNQRLTAMAAPHLKAVQPPKRS